MNKKNVWSIFSWTIVILIGFFAIALIGVRIIGFTPYAIVSPSMTPEYCVGDLVYVQSVDSQNIQVGDVITFVANKDKLVVTHRVVEIDKENNQIYTKGDANTYRDASPVNYENVIGVVKFSISKLGYISAFLQTKPGKYVGLAIIIIFILIEFEGLIEMFRQEQLS